jgi:SAM-dependent MidA family methyltransferase
VGRQDLTADVDFRALALHGAQAGFDCLVYTSLAAFLRGMGAGEELDHLRAQAARSLDRDMEASALEALMVPGGLGESFKVMVQVREGPATERPPGDGPRLETPSSEAGRPGRAGGDAPPVPTGRARRVW